MTLPLRRKHQTTRRNSRPWKNISIAGVLTLGLLGTHVPLLTAADLAWGRPATNQRTQVANKTISFDEADQAFAESEESTSFDGPSDVSHESAVMAAAWEEDDALAAELNQAPEELVEEESAAPAGEARSVLTKQNPLNTVDPFGADERFAQLPNDPFDEPTGDAIPELDQNQNLDDVENALDREVERREEETQERAEEADTEESEFDSAEEASEFDVREPGAIEDSQAGEEEPESDFNFELRTPAKTEPETIRPFQQEGTFADELEQSQESCEDELAALRADRINTVDLSIRVEGVAGEDFPYECELGRGQLEPRVWPEITYTWKASALCSKPLYFEQVGLERYGHSCLPDVQPLVSGAHFFGSVAMLPYKMGIETPNECIYALGHYRPGSCAPYYIPAVPFTWRAAGYQTGILTGIHFAFP
jgi:hypothetical protein